MLLATNGQGELPVESAIRHGQDDVAAFLIRRMDHRRFVHARFVVIKSCYLYQSLLSSLVCMDLQRFSIECRK